MYMFSRFIEEGRVMDGRDMGRRGRFRAGRMDDHDAHATRMQEAARS